MAPIFASADIATLVSSFEPTIPTRNHPSLVRSRCGNGLITSQEVLTRFRRLLKTSTSRIKLSNLPTRLDVGTADWVIKCYDGDLYYGEDSQTLLAFTDIPPTLEKLKDRLRAGVWEFQRLASAVDVKLRSLEQLLALGTSAESVEYFQDDADGRRYVYTPSHLDSVQTTIRTELAENPQARVNLSQRHPSFPITLLETVASDAVVQEISADGTFETIDGDFFYVSSAFVSVITKKEEAARESEVQAAVEQLHDKGFFRSTSHNAIDDARYPRLHDIQERYMQVRGNSDNAVERIVQEDSDAVLLVVSSRLRELIETMKQSIPELTARAWRERQGSESTASLKTTIVEQAGDTSPSPELALHIIRSDHRPEIDRTVDSAIAEHEAEDDASFAILVQERLSAPLQLYTEGLGSVHDASLKQNLDVFLGDHFRRELVPSVLATMGDLRLLLDRARKRDVDKLQQSNNDAKTLSDVQAAVTKLSKKHKIDAPDTALVQRVKQETLQQRAKSIRSMKRGSDLLQNLIWVLLARQCPGLFMSSGKDTSRMIKQYISVGDVEVGRQLEMWRDVLKAGKEGAAELEAMRSLGMKAAMEAAGTQLADGQ